MPSIKVAIEGCCHGELNKIYHQIRMLPQKEKPELLVICGDFQAARNRNDLLCISMPPKYRRLGDFQDYYTGSQKAPVLTIFVGGNHEASNHLQELKFGGWVAPNIYYLGQSNVVWYKGLRIGSISGIYNDQNFMKPSNEVVPYDHSTIRSVYHVRKRDYLKMLFFETIRNDKKPLDIMISHDWPQGIEHHGNMGLLLKKKPFFQKDIETGRLGSPVNRNLMYHLLPRYWFSAHLHVKFEAVYKPQTRSVLKENPQKNTNEISIEMDDSSDEEPANIPLKNANEIQIELSDSEDEHSTDNGSLLCKHNKYTQFLSLDKCLPKRQFFSVKTIKVAKPAAGARKTGNGLYYDELFLKIHKYFNNFVKTPEYQALSKSTLLDENQNSQLRLFLNAYKDEILKEELPLTNSRIDLSIPRNFIRDVDEKDSNAQNLVPRTNEQTKQFCEKFGIDLYQNE